MRLVQEGRCAVTFGLLETLRLGETTTGIPLARVVVEKRVRKKKEAASEKMLTADMMVSLQRLREGMMMRGESRGEICTLSGVGTWWGLKGRIYLI